MHRGFAPTPEQWIVFGTVATGRCGWDYSILARAVVLVCPCLGATVLVLGAACWMPALSMNTTVKSSVFI